MNRSNQISCALKQLRKRIADVYGNEPDDDVPFLQGIPALPHPDDERLRLEKEFADAVEECLNLCTQFPEVSIYVDPIDHSPIVVKLPGREGEGLLGFDRCEWRKLAKAGLPDLRAIGDYTHLLLRLASEPDEEFVIEGDVENVPARGTNQLIAETVLDEVLKNFEKQNMVFSPLGVASILEMLQLCAGRHSLLSRRIASLLNGFAIDDFESEILGGITLEHGTSIWYNPSVGRIKEHFVSQLHHSFHTQPHAVDFADTDHAKALVDKWVTEKTHGMIEQLDVALSPETLMLLVDALHLKAAWDVPFDPNDTRCRTFNNADGTTSRVDMMHLRTHEAYYERTDDYQAVELQYADYDVSMTIVMPHEGKDFSDVIRQLDWIDVDPEDDYDIDLRLPRFKLDSRIALKETLAALGLGELFDPETALTGMTDEPAHISQILQQCALSVTEDGSEAAPATVVEAVEGCPPSDYQPKYHRMTVDRPFGFAIHDVNRNVLFVGIVNHLDDSRPAEPATPPREGKFVASMTVAGTTHIKDIEKLADDIVAGTELHLRREPDNRHDPHAIGVYHGPARIGFVPCENNEILANLIDAGLDLFAIVTSADWRGNWLRLQASILLPL